ncbi:hypothetical protein U3516DRAFT_663747 [Neocallimastix sp. 'constans']
MEQYEAQVEHMQLLKEVINQKYGKDSAQSIIHKLILEKKKLARKKSITQSIQTELNGSEIDESLNSINLMTTKIKALESSTENSLNKITDMKESFKVYFIYILI